MMIRKFLGLVLIGSVVLAPGCGPSTETGAADPEPTPAEQVGQLLNQYREQNKPAPKSLKEAEKSATAFPKAIEALKSGEVVIYWGVNLDEYGGASVIGYEKGVPEQGGMVILGDGSTSELTAELFQQAPKPPAAKLNQSGSGKSSR